MSLGRVPNRSIALNSSFFCGVSYVDEDSQGWTLSVIYKNGVHSCFVTSHDSSELHFLLQLSLNFEEK
uniref:Uncharacterized protein n=1 Tax=Megaselia scalaris TaxID=36166 RepID=T1GN52_MEGSC